MNLLIIEDSEALSWRLKNHLGEQFFVQVANDAESGLEKVGSNKYDAIVLDLGLPDKSGAEVCQTIRKSDLNTPILVLTGDAALNSKVKLFDYGADDYLTKPFSIGELRARIKALHRRSNMQPDAKPLAVDNLVLDASKREAKRGNEVIRLRRKEFDILEYLVRNQDQVVTREMIYNHVWGNQTETWSNTVDVHIKYLRDKIDRPFRKQLIKTIYGLGYMLSAK